MHRARTLLLQRSQQLALSRPPALQLRQTAPQQSAALVAVAGLSLVALGATYAYRTVMRSAGGAGPTAKVPPGYVAHPGLNDEHSTVLASAFYQGGFEDPMTRSEAAKILGVRESANRERILERYRALMKINHPDRGGSPLLAHKVNEAKELLAKSSASSKN